MRLVKQLTWQDSRQKTLARHAEKLRERLLKQKLSVSRKSRKLKRLARQLKTQKRRGSKRSRKLKRLARQLKTHKRRGSKRSKKLKQRALLQLRPLPTPSKNV